MKYHTRIILAFNRLKRRYTQAEDRGIYAVCALIRLEARQDILGRPKRGASAPGFPPHPHTTAGLREINFDVRKGEQSGIVGPRKFPHSRFFNRPVPNIHEKGGIAIKNSYRLRYRAIYPERSFMWAAVKSLHSKGKIPPRFAATVRTNF